MVKKVGCGSIEGALKENGGSAKIASRTPFEFDTELVNYDCGSSRHVRLGGVREIDLGHVKGLLAHGLAANAIAERGECLSAFSASKRLAEIEHTSKKTGIVMGDIVPYASISFYVDSKNDGMLKSIAEKAGFNECDTLETLALNIFHLRKTDVPGISEVRLELAFSNDDRRDAVLKELTTHHLSENLKLKNGTIPAFLEKLLASKKASLTRKNTIQ